MPFAVPVVSLMYVSNKPPDHAVDHAFASPTRVQPFDR